MKDLDETDKKLLNLIQRGDLCVPRVTKIAHLMKLPTTTIHTRLKKLQKSGIIEGYLGRVDSKKAGLGLTTFTILKVEYPKRYTETKQVEDFGKKLAQIPEIQEVHVCSGRWDYFLKVKATSPENYAKMIFERLTPLGGIVQSESNVVYKTFKETPVVKV